MRIAVSLIVIVGLGVAVTTYRHVHRYKHFATHEQGNVYRSAWLEPDVMSEVIEANHIRSVVNLCKPGELGEARWEQERKAVRDSGARLIEIEMPVTLDLDEPLIAQHLEVLSDPKNFPLLVHCQHGVTRTAKFLAIYDIVFRGQSAEASLKAQPLFGRSDHNVNVKAFVQNFEKEHHKVFPTADAVRLAPPRR